MPYGENDLVIQLWRFETRKLPPDREGKPVYNYVPLDKPRSHRCTVFTTGKCESPVGAHS